MVRADSGAVDAEPETSKTGLTVCEQTPRHKVEYRDHISVCYTLLLPAPVN